MHTFSDLRKNAGFASQSAFADKIGVDRAVVARWETGQNYPRTPLIPEIAKLLHTTSDNVIESIKASCSGT